MMWTSPRYAFYYYRERHRLKKHQAEYDRTHQGMLFDS